MGGGAKAADARRPLGAFEGEAEGVGMVEPEPQGSLRLEHFAFSATGFKEFIARLEAQQIPFRLGSPAEFPIRQVGISDPDGNHLHVDFPESETV